MAGSVESLKHLAEVVGWKRLAEDKGFTSFEYKKNMSRTETVTYLLRIFDEPHEEDFYQSLFIIKNVLPRTLRKKVDKITKKIKPEEIAGVVEVITFAIEEFKDKNEYALLKKYGEMVGVDIEKAGYAFEYELPKSKCVDIVALIESHLPTRVLPKIGRIKNIEFKIAWVRDHKNELEEN